MLYTRATTPVPYTTLFRSPITVTLGSNPNYSVTSTDSTLTINQATATVSADPKSKIYGDDNPALTATVVGQIAGDIASKHALTPVTDESSNPASYRNTITL